jgi:hypothetical protein
MLPKTRTHYWSSSNLAAWIRGEEKPAALAWEDWNKYYNDLKSKKPWRYWITEHMFKKLQNIVYYPYDIYRHIKYYIRNRFIDKTHYLHTGLEPGHYYEFDERILHGLFNELVDFVEIELAHTSKWDATKDYKFKNGRCIEAGLAYLEWASCLRYEEDWIIDKSDKRYGQFTSQALSAQKIRELYDWWTISRPNRPEPHIVAEYDKVVGESIFNGKISKKKKACFNQIRKIEESYEKEDTNKLIELIKLRKHLWT